MLYTSKDYIQDLQIHIYWYDRREDSKQIKWQYEEEISISDLTSIDSRFQNINTNINMNNNKDIVVLV